MKYEKTIYVCDITGKESSNKDNFIETCLYAGDVFDGYDRWEDDYKTYHFHKSISKKKIKNKYLIETLNEKKKQMSIDEQEELSKYLDGLRLEASIKNKGKNNGK